MTVLCTAQVPFSLDPGWGLSFQGQASSPMANSSTCFYSKRFDSFHAGDSRASDHMASLPVAGATGCSGSQGGRHRRCESLPPTPHCFLPLLSIPAALALIRRPALRARWWLPLSHILLWSLRAVQERLEVRNACVWDTGRAAPTCSTLLNVMRPDLTHSRTNRDGTCFYSAAPGRS